MMCIGWTVRVLTCGCRFVLAFVLFVGTALKMRVMWVDRAKLFK